MTEEQQLKLQTFLDGELPEDEARAVASWIAQDAEATALVAELRHTRKALKESQPAVLRVPESREFYWSKIQRQINRLEQEPAPKAERSWLGWIRRFAAAGTVGAAMVLALWLGLRMDTTQQAVAAASEMTVADSGAFTYRDYASGTTLIWVSYPADR